MGDRWNPNLHALEALLDRHVGSSARRAIDVGCGEGETARRLRQRVELVVGLDRDEDSIEEARSYGDDIDYRLGDLQSAELEPRSFDVVTAVAMLHHIDQRSGLLRLTDLVAPGGVLIVVSHARSRTIADYARDARDVIGVRRYSWTRKVWSTPSPSVWPPPLSYGETRAASLDVLPEAKFRRVPYFRYALTWTNPVG